MSRRGSRQTPSLDRLERWFQGEIVRPNVPARAGKRAEPTHADRVLPSRSLTSAERIAIYSRMFFARLHDVLAEDYPSLVHVLGTSGFEKFARAYLAKHPSRHYSLAGLGRHVPRFLETAARMPRRERLADLARIELATSEVFDAPEAATLRAADLRSVPPARHGDLRLRLVPAFRLLALRSAANAIVTAIRQKKPLPSFARRPSWVAVYRREFAVWRMDLTEPQFAMLTTLSRGRTLASAIRAAARATSGAPEILVANIGRWFAEWTAEGFFAEAELDGVAVRPRARGSLRHAIRGRRIGNAVGESDARRGVVSNAPRLRR